MKKTKKVDIAIIGAGTSGMSAYREATKYTDSVVLIEGNSFGTTCARVGCMPSKLLIAAADAAGNGKNAHEFGVIFDEPKIDGKSIMDRIKKERDRFVGFVLDSIEEWPKDNIIRGYAKFKSNNTLLINDDYTVEADRIIIATGSSPKIPNSFKIFKDKVITNNDIFYWDDLPDSVIVFGAGVIGLEIGQALSKLGVEVSIIGRNNKLGPLTDKKVINEAINIFKAKYNFYPDADILNKQILKNKALVEFKSDNKVFSKSFEYVLAATGRETNLNELNLENTSIKLNSKGIPKFDIHDCLIENTNIFIAGDANSYMPLLHEAADDGKIAGFNAGHYPDTRIFKRTTPLTVIFSDPQIMLVGKRFQELMDDNISFEVGEVNWKNQGRSRVILQNEGILRVYGEKFSGKFLGAEMIGPKAENIAHLLAWSIESNLTVDDILKMPFYHPVIEEGVRSAFRDLNYNLNMSSKYPKDCIDCGPGS